MADDLRTDRCFALDDPPTVVWAALRSVEDYHRWWPWLRRFEAQALASGERWTAHLRVPVPRGLRLGLHLICVEEPTRVAATVTGDVEGTATVTIDPRGAGSVIRLRATLAPRHPVLRAVNRTVPALSRRMHDRVVERAFEQFGARAGSEVGSADR